MFVFVRLKRKLADVLGTSPSTVIRRFKQLVHQLPEKVRLAKARKTFKNWQKEILNSYAFGYSNGFLEGINNTSKVLKRNAYGFRKFEHYKAKILLNHVYKNVGIHLG